MSYWSDDLERWRDPEMWDEDTEITDELVVAQFVYSVITDFVEQNGGPLAMAMMSDSDRDFDRLLDGWIKQKQMAVAR